MFELKGGPESTARAKRFCCALLVGLTASSAGQGCAHVAVGAVTAASANSKRSQIEANRKPELTQLQIREMQTKVIDDSDRIKILSVALAVLQDDGFMVENSDTALGNLSARKRLHAEDVDDVATAFIKGMLGAGGTISRQRFSSIAANVTVTPYGDKTRVRFSAQLSETSTSGTVREELITEPEYYQEFFTKLYKGLFIEQEQI